MCASKAAEAATESPSIAPLIDLLSSEMARVNTTILDRMDSKVPLVPQLAGHLFAAGG